jgi:hypothetical protein
VQNDGSLVDSKRPERIRVCEPRSARRSWPRVDQPATRDLVDARQLLGEQHGLVQRQSITPVATVIVVVRERERDRVKKRDRGSDAVVRRLWAR